MWIFLKAMSFCGSRIWSLFKTFIKCVFVCVKGADGGVRVCVRGGALRRHTPEDSSHARIELNLLKLNNTFQNEDF